MQQLLRAAPSGDVAFLFSDIEGSTARWSMYPEAMPVYLHRHDELLHAAIAQNGGTVFKTVGDEFCAAFDCAESALRAAVDAQHALAAEDWSAVGGLRVRMAVHSGPVTERGGDYFGSTVNRVARLLSAGHGGQILVSADAARNLEHVAESGVSLRDLGRHRLKDFPELDSIYQLVAPSLPEMFPPLRTVAERPSNLPQYLPPLLGREHDLAQVRERLAAHRLVSIIGAGGVGKTSIAVQIGADVLGEYEDGVWLSELAPVDAGAVATTIAGVFGITGAGGGSTIDAVAAHLKTKRLLLVIDNCEHVTAAAAAAIDAILRTCAGVHVLATSREPLNLRGEALYRLPVLAVPPENAVLAEDVRKYGACELFAERARAHVAAFAITDENARTVARICRRLDGIALAIELAAPRLRVLSLNQLADRLAERFRLLTGGSREALPHHQTLRALIDWSYGLLSENERMLLRRSALFPGGWSIGGAVEVCADETLEEWDLLDHLTSLVDKSLVVVDACEPEPRYRMLESTREYALERLDESGERDCVGRRHAEYFYGLASRADEAWSHVPANEWIAPLAIELDNVRAALSWCITQKNDTLLGIRLFGALEAFWWDAQPIEGRRWIADITPMLPGLGAPAEIARFWLTIANVELTLRQQKTALDAAEQALQEYRELADPVGIARAKRCVGAALINLGRPDEGEPLVVEALESFRIAGDRRLAGLALRSLGLGPHFRGDIARATEIYHEALEIAQAVGDERGVQVLSNNLAEIEADAGNYLQALQYANSALEIARTRRDETLLVSLLLNSSAYLIALGRLDEARLPAREALDLSLQIENDLYAAIAIAHFGAISAARREVRRAAHLLGYSDAVFRMCGSAREATEANEYAIAMDRIAAELDPDTIEALRLEGEQLTPQQAAAESRLV